MASKFQLRYTSLVAVRTAKDIKPLLSQEQVAMLRSHSSAASAPALMGLPHGFNAVPNAQFQYIAQHRLLLTNICQLLVRDKCAAYPLQCAGRGATVVGVTKDHLEVCTSCVGGEHTFHHGGLQGAVREMFKSVGA